MTPRDTATWLPSALLLLHISGCSPLSGPSIVTGTIGGSLSVQCQYEKEYKTSNKYWCRQPLLLPLPCTTMVETKESGREATGSRVSIRDHPASLTFTVTLENLTLEDVGSYWCGIATPWHEIVDEHLTVVVSVFPDLATASSLDTATSSLEPPKYSPVPSWTNKTREDPHGPSLRPRSLLSSIYFLLLVFLEVPVLLSMLSVVIWVNRPQRNSEGRSQPNHENQ